MNSTKIIIKKNIFIYLILVATLLGLLVMSCLLVMSLGIIYCNGETVEHVPSINFPTDATSIKSIGNNWYTFNLDNNTFLLYRYNRLCAVTQVQ